LNFYAVRDAERADEAVHDAICIGRIWRSKPWSGLTYGTQQLVAKLNPSRVDAYGFFYSQLSSRIPVPLVTFKFETSLATLSFTIAEARHNF
jgi:hypothetical protein